MPQDIPLESKETLHFVPGCFKDIENAPSFALKACTSREKRQHRRLSVEAGIEYHDTAAIRAEFIRGLEAMWDKQKFEEYAPVIRDMWQRQDDYDLQASADPDFEYPAKTEIELAYEPLMKKVIKHWLPLREMQADNDDANRMQFILLNAVVIKDFANLEVHLRQEAGCLTLDTIEEVKEALEAFEEAKGMTRGLAWMELGTACARRMRLLPEEVGNSESQSQSPTAPVLSNETSTSEKGGKSQVSARSKKTRATA